jgi:hypothetical protein
VHRAQPYVGAVRCREVLREHVGLDRHRSL